MIDNTLLYVYFSDISLYNLIFFRTHEKATLFPLAINSLPKVDECVIKYLNFNADL